MCTPRTNRSTECGPYDINLSEGDVKQVADIKISNIPVGETCTYRANSRCGYPAVDLIIQNETLLQGFDVAFATYDGLWMFEDLDW